MTSINTVCSFVLQCVIVHANMTSQTNEHAVCEPCSALSPITNQNQCLGLQPDWEGSSIDKVKGKLYEQAYIYVCNAE